ncbi:hypothetical protein Afil01_47860 [Actinorhabdospora filicis]|uniref:DUF1579 domain-containing protein n=1 Tax=Actinorhabdospora filicis TaxID=1785913 RepID=A0A9W6SN57_9ACTN|nr:hypothetical protein [Actinorhabdospora filicis]GLZ79979.1 hypothetical protein Afil01_47860 [Actinorhabdospora filicis]
MSDSHDFDPYFGQWKLHTRKLRDVLDPDCEEWIEFDGSNDVQPILGGLGNIEKSVNYGEEDFYGMSIRLFDPAAGVWRIWWASSKFPGQMGVPNEGVFTDGVGTFVTDEELNGRMTRVRFQWTGIAEGKPRWEQSFSYDEGATWKLNWVTTSHR